MTIIIGFVGGSNSGKTTLVKEMYKKLSKTQHVVCISMDSFYKNPTYDQILQIENNNYNFDDPNAVDIPLFLQTLEKIIAGQMVSIPQYDFVTNRRTTRVDTIDEPEIVLLDGLFLYTYEEIRRLIDIKVYIDADDDVRLARRIQRDVLERGRTVESVLSMYNKFVKPGYEKFVLPSKQFADIILTNNSSVAVEILCCYLESCE